MTTYTINRYSDDFFDNNRDPGLETFPFNINEKELNVTATSIRLFGRGFENYGEIVAESFLHILENFTGITPPDSPITGQLWYQANANDPGKGHLFVWNGNQWKTAARPTISNDFPNPNNFDLEIGDFLYHEVKQKMYYWDGNNWRPYSQAWYQNNPPLPGDELTGDFWWSPEQRKFYIYTSAEGWRDVGPHIQKYDSSANLSTPEVDEGDLWYTTDDKVLYVRRDQDWQAIAIGHPSANPTQNTFLTADTVNDDSSNTHEVWFIESQGRPIASFSRDTFVLDSNDSRSSNFPEIYKGLTFSEDPELYNNIYSGDIIPLTDETYSLGEQNRKWNNFFVSKMLLNDGSATDPSLTFNNDRDTGLYRSGNDNLSFTTNGQQRLEIRDNGAIEQTTTNGFKVPVGDISQRPNTETGFIRYNTDDNRLEVYNNGWVGFGDTKLTDLNQTTWVSVEDSPGANNNQVKFRTNGTDRIMVDSDGVFVPFTDSTYDIGRDGTRFKDGYFDRIDLRYGSQTEPSLTFKNNTNTGIFRDSADHVSITTGGTKRLDFDNDGMTMNNGQFRMVDGSESSPVLTFNNNRDMGIYRSGFDQYTMVTNGNERFTIDNSGMIMNSGTIRLLDGTQSNPGIQFANNSGSLGLRRKNNNDMSVVVSDNDRISFKINSIDFTENRNDKNRGIHYNGRVGFSASSDDSVLRINEDNDFDTVTIKGATNITNTLDLNDNVTIDGNLTVQGSTTLNSGTSITADLDMNNNNINNVNEMFGLATEARYADLAERYHADNKYNPGTIVKLGGKNEITQTEIFEDPDVFGVISDNPGFKMNGEAGSDDTHPYVAFTGRVYCKVKGPVKRNQRIVSCSTPGVGIAKDRKDINDVFSVIGRVIDNDFSEHIRSVEIIIGVK